MQLRMIMPPETLIFFYCGYSIKKYEILSVHIVIGQGWSKRHVQLIGLFQSQTNKQSIDQYLLFHVKISKWLKAYFSVKIQFDGKMYFRRKEVRWGNHRQNICHANSQVARYEPMVVL